METVTIGYAVKTQSGEIDVRTVSPTTRAAQVNGLVLAGWHVGGRCPDAEIAAAWAGAASATGSSIVMVEIREKERADG